MKKFSSIVIGAVVLLSLAGCVAPETTDKGRELTSNFGDFCEEKGGEFSIINTLDSASFSCKFERDQIGQGFED